MQEAIILILTIIVLFQFIVNGKLLSSVNKLKKEKKMMDEKIDSTFEIKVGSKVTFKYGLTYKPSKEDFQIIYEAYVIEVSDKSVKVNPYDFSPENKVPDALIKANTNYHNSILGFINDKWIDKSEISLIRDKESVRNYKLDEILK